MDIEACSALLLSGEIVAIPTDTIYGLAVLASDAKAVERLFNLKKRPQNKPMVIQLSHADQLNHFGVLREASLEALIGAFWPGALTLVLDIDKASVAEPIRAGSSTTAFRIPDHELTLKILKKTGPLVVTSANVSDQASATTPNEIKEIFGANIPIFDDGDCNGLASTILNFKKGRWSLLREGAIEAQRFESVLGYIPQQLFE